MFTLDSSTLNQATIFTIDDEPGRAILEDLMLSQKWQRAIECTDYAFQPIVNTLTGSTFALEALIRGVNKAGFHSIDHFFTSAYQEGVLFSVDIALRRKAILKFLHIPFHQKLRLFYNYDHRVVEMPNYQSGIFEQLLEELGVATSVICLELTEKHHYNYSHTSSFRAVLELVKQRGFTIAIDDFGVGHASFELLYHSDPDIIKIDRFLISSIQSDIKKKSYCSHIVSLAHLQGVTVVAEGIETEDEYSVCREIGCDLIQGYLVAYPTEIVSELAVKYDKIREFHENQRRNISNDKALLLREMVHIEPLEEHTPMEDLFTRMRLNEEFNYLPVIDKLGKPLGIIREKTLKKYIYSPYGKELLCNRWFTHSLRKYIDDSPVADIHMPLEKILSIFAQNAEAEGVQLTENQRYIGFLTAKSLLNTLNEKNLAFARDVNPLSKLPGNILINDHIVACLSDTNHDHYLIYFDFDNFKPFNDRFGFRQGDRAILLFTDILKKSFTGHSAFVGHIGGDDFFVALTLLPERKNSAENIRDQVAKVLLKFTDAIAPFYTEEEIRQGCYHSRDRSGQECSFTLLRVSAAIMLAEQNQMNITLDNISSILADTKKKAKKSPEGIAFFAQEIGCYVLESSDSTA
ncbi:GGDEF domain-containing protein [Chrysiogenes arsenatis]|uniref:GGDEF domain-containing protein n=1 Tax=Chrysiogenes arsenatis TaxID=309797 RepID=UPI0004003A0E|nr:GGDEF domain-containing protein [Chrysiogenes arsenatis]